MRIGITIGDLNGVGLEVIIKTLSNSAICNICTPIIYANSKIVAYHKNIVERPEFQFQNAKNVNNISPGKINVVNCWQDQVNISLGKATSDGGKYALKSLEWAVTDLQKNLIDAVVTAPINKHAMQLADFPHPGHTEYFTHQFNVEESLMTMVSDSLRVALVTNHIPLSEVTQKVTKSLILKKLNIFYKSLQVDFGILKPKIALLGLNPHAGDEGMIGTEENAVIKPVVTEAKKKGKLVYGPFPADGFFGSGMFKKYDGILAMYHDQGLVAFKSLSFGNGVNFTAGLPIVRTSPDHGTGFDIAGENKADPASFRQALFTAIDIVRSRKDYQEDHANPLKNRKSKLENSVDEAITEDMAD